MARHLFIYDKSSYVITTANTIHDQFTVTTIVGGFDWWFLYAVSAAQAIFTTSDDNNKRDNKRERNKGDTHQRGRRRGAPALYYIQVTHTHTHTHSQNTGIYRQTSLTDQHHRSTTLLFRSLYFGPKRPDIQITIQF